MKLVDMLVEDGLNGWRWPEGAEKATSYRHIQPSFLAASAASYCSRVTPSLLNSRVVKSL